MWKRLAALGIPATAITLIVTVGSAQYGLPWAQPATSAATPPAVAQVEVPVGDQVDQDVLALVGDLQAARAAGTHLPGNVDAALDAFDKAEEAVTVMEARNAAVCAELDSVADALGDDTWACQMGTAATTDTDAATLGLPPQDEYRDLILNELR